MSDTPELPSVVMDAIRDLREHAYSAGWHNRDENRAETTRQELAADATSRALRAAIAAYADAERQAGWFAGLHAGQEQGRTNAAIEGAAQIDAYIASERLEAYNLGAAIEREATDTAYGDGRGAALAEIDAACERIAGADRHGNVNLTFWADDIGWEVGTDDTSKPIAGFPTPTAALLAALGVADDGGGAS